MNRSTQKTTPPLVTCLGRGKAVIRPTTRRRFDATTWHSISLFSPSRAAPRPLGQPVAAAAATATQSAVAAAAPAALGQPESVCLSPRWLSATVEGY